MSLAMQAVLDILQEHNLNKEADTLQSFYESVQMRAAGIESAEGKQKVIKELYGKFFENAFPAMAKRMGIVYTPVEVVDFIIYSVNHILQTEFGQSLGSKGVHILDPFTGTGTFITRLLQSGLITPEQLPYKYQNEIHANEIVLLAYYIAAINIEAVYHSIVGGNYQPFEGICLTDTFQLYEKEDLVDALLVQNSARRKRQKKLDIRVIIGNPPYSGGQKDDNDDAANTKYNSLDESIQATYAKRSDRNPRSLYNSYVRAIRWASDRIKNSGVIGFVSGSGFVDKPAMDGLRKCVQDEFTNVYVLDLRGDIRKNMFSKGRAKEGQNIFGSGSMNGISITFFVKNPYALTHGNIYYCDIGDELSREQKLTKISEFGSTSGIAGINAWQVITPDQHGDWLKQRDDSFSQYIALGDKKKKNIQSIFRDHSRGVTTSRDCWAYSHSKRTLLENMARMIKFYNDCIDSQDKADINDAKNISWSWVLRLRYEKKQKGAFDPSRATVSLYRPFTKMWLYYDGIFNENRYSIPRIYPEPSSCNLVICVSGVGARSGFSTLITDKLPNLHALDTDQCFPLYLFSEPESNSESLESLNADLFAIPEKKSGKQRRDALTDEGLAHFQSAYPGDNICKEDVFYYVYGLLHSPDYRERYADNLSKELPRIPRVKAAADFWAFSKAGRKLAELHLNYETVEPYPLKIESSGNLTDADYRVEKMKYGKTGKEKELTTLHYNDKITLTGIPLEAYDYIVNGKPALDWVVERQCVKTDKDSGIVNDANDWAVETMGNLRYPLELFQRVVTVSLETMKIVRALPALEI